MSQSSLKEALEATGGGHSLEELVLKFEQKEFEHFDVEFAVQGDDLVYHFWPTKNQKWFLPVRDPTVFGKALEEGFKNTLPQNADVRADYTDPEESLVLLRMGESPDSLAKPRETYSVRVIGWASNPMCDRFLKDEVFHRIEEAVRRAIQ
jgi:hypothetical protein